MKVLDEKTRRIITASYALPDLETAVQQVIYNAIDARAKTIKLVVDIMTASFTAVDDGCGILPDSLYTHVGEHHASARFSALEREDSEQSQPKPYGSRGAFLYELTSLATTVEIESRAQAHWSSYRKVFQEGKVVFNARSKDLRQASGTKVYVSNLFGKLPVRRKDLSRNMKHRARVTKGIQSFCVSMSMIWPSLSFDIQYQGGDVRPVAIPAAASCRVRFLEHFGHLLGEQLQYVKYSSETFNFSIRGYYAFIPGACEELGQGVKQAKSYYQFAFLGNEWEAECHQVCSRTITEAALEFASAIPIFVLKVDVAGDQYDACEIGKKERIRFKAPDQFRQFLSEFVQEMAATKAKQDKIHESGRCEVPLHSTTVSEPEHEPPALIPNDFDDIESIFPDNATTSHSFDHDAQSVDYSELPVSCTTDDAAAWSIESPNRLSCGASDHIENDSLSFSNEMHCSTTTTYHVPQAAEAGFTSIDVSHEYAVSMQSEDDFEGIFFNQEPSVPPVGSAGNAIGVEETGVPVMPWLSSKPDAHDCADLLFGLCEDSNYDMNGERSKEADRKEQHIDNSPFYWDESRDDDDKRPIPLTPTVVNATSDYFSVQKVERSANEFLRRRSAHRADPVRRFGSTLYADNVHIMAGGKTIKITKFTLAKLQVIRQVDRKFILVRAATPQGTLLLCIDQHAADERVRLEKLERDVFGHDGSLCEVELHDHEPPLALRVNAKEYETMQYHEELIKGWGFEFECMASRPAPAFINVSDSTEFLEERRVALHATPKVEKRVSNAEDFREFIQFLSNAGGTYVHSHVRPPVITRLLHSRACRSAIMFGDRLSMTQCQELIEELKTCHLPFQCAHGRPSVVPLAEICNGNLPCGSSPPASYRIER
uniref:MutL C-terminal dimerisation domain-containing protein n=1 Tax=Peronospora matthiolae TaxID=2874970 RepID=A0AAV1VF58_9STRA